MPSSISTRQLTYSPITRIFSADVSDLPDLELVQIYPDSADRGFTLISHDTGREVALVHNHEEKNAEGEVLCDIFIPANPRERHLFKKVVIFND